jgi:hypothetical protein
MINTNRIVPVTKIDLISLYALIMSLAGTSYTTIDATDVNGDFEMESGSGNVIASQPVTTFDFATGVSSAVVYFVPAFDYTGFSINGTAVTPETASVEVAPDGVSLYTATLASGKVTIAKVGV